MNMSSLTTQCILLLAINLELTVGLTPILIVPGLTGSRLDAKVSGPTLCNTLGLWEPYWINLLHLPKCLARAAKLEYDNATNTYTNVTGVEVRVHGFGETKAVEFMDPLEIIPYFHKFVEFFVERGYTRGETIRAAPYDWRLAADELERLGYFLKLQDLVEEMYAASGEKVTIVAHSMGGPISLYFFNHVVSQQWKDQYINAFIPLSGAWSGGNQALAIFLSGLSSLHSILLHYYAEALTPAAQSMESLLWMLPNPTVWKDKALVTTETRNYTANQYQEMFNDIESHEDYTKLQRVLLINGDYPAPNVSVHCFYGIDLKTPEVFHYGDGFPSTILTTTNGDGDNTVNLLSSEICLRWASQEALFSNKTFSKVSHIEMVTNQEVLDAVAEAIGLSSSDTKCAVSILLIVSTLAITLSNLL